MLLIPLGSWSQTAFFPNKQDFRIEQFLATKGLVSSQIRAVIQDNEGYIWIGTQGGLVRYDGYNFQLYKYQSDDSLSLTNNFVTNLYLDRAGVLWVGTKYGLSQYDPQIDGFHRLFPDPSDLSSLPGGEVSDIQEDAKGRLWVAIAFGGLSRYDPDRNAFENYFHDPTDENSLSSNQVGVLYLDRKGDLWVGAGFPWDEGIHVGGLNRYDPDRDAFTRYLHHPGQPNSLGFNEVSLIHEDSRGFFWVGTWDDGLQLLDRETGSFSTGNEAEISGQTWPDSRSANGSSGAIRSLHEDAQGNLWIGGFGGGLDRYDFQSGVTTHYPVQAGIQDYISSPAIWTIWEDRQHILWVGTMYGLNKVIPEGAQIKAFGSLTLSPFSLQDNQVEEILQDSKGRWWLGTWAGLEQVFPLRDSTELFRPGDNAPIPQPSERILALMEDSQEKIWVGSLNYGVSQFDPETRQFTRFHLESDLPSGGDPINICALAEDQDGQIWAGGSQGLFQINRQAQSLSKIPLPPEAEAPIGMGVFGLLYAGNKILWVGTGSGLFRVHTETGKYEHVVDRLGIRVIMPDGEDGLWLGTEWSGLWYYDLHTKSLENYSMEHGLPEETIRSLIKDQTGKLWVSTELGLASFDPAKKHFQPFPPAFPLPINSFNPHASWLQADGKLLFGGIGGVVGFNPAGLLADSITPIPMITQLKVMEKAFRTLKKPGSSTYLLENGEPSFAYDENDLTFSFVGLHFTAPEANQYRYRLQNYENSWREVGTQRTAIYPNLPPGSYTFEVQAANKDGIWSSMVASMKVSIRPPWWQTYWAFLLYTLTLIGGVWAVNRLQRRRLIRAERSRARVREAQLRAEAAEAQSDQLLELDKAKARLYANITHEFRTPLTVIMGMVDRIRGHREERSLIRRNSQNLLRLINQLLDLSKLESGNLELNPVHGDIIHYLLYLTESFYSLAQEKGIRLMFYPEVKSLHMDYDDGKIQHIIYNLLSNALKFTPEGGKVILHAIQIEREGRPFLQLKVQDTGIGIAPNQLEKIFDRFYQVDTSPTRQGEGTGIGLSLTHELVELMGGEISVESTVGAGTTFTVILPIEVAQDTPSALPLAIQETDSPSLTQDLPLLEDISKDGKPVMVLIEDNRDVTTYLQAILQDQYIIHTESSGQAGIDRVWETIPDIVISDVMMPEKDGFEVCKRLKSDERSSHIPIILLTAKAEMEDRLTGLREGADAYLVKPFEKEELFIRLEKLRELREALKLRYQGNRSLFRTPPNQLTSHPDDAFIQKLILVVHNRLDDPTLGVNDLCRAAKLSSTQVNRKIKALLGKTTSQFIRMVRLHKALDLLEGNELSVSEVGYSVGFSDPNYFSRSFSEEFGYPPSALRK